jgi:hypothetical protein
MNRFRAPSQNRSVFGGAEALRWGGPTDQLSGPVPAFDWTQFNNPGLLQNPWGDGATPNYQAIGDWLDKNKYQFVQENGPGEQYNWIQDQDGNFVTEPKNYFQDDDLFWKAALAAGALTGANIAGAGGGISGGGGFDSLIGGGTDAIASGATNPALIESAVGTPGYGLSSAGAGGGAGALIGGGATNAALAESAVGTPGYGLSSAGAGGGAGMGLLDTLGSLIPGNATDWARLGLGLYGASQSRDGQTEVSRAPWKPAQPYLEALLGDLGTLRQRFMQQPVAPERQRATANMGALADIGRQMAPGLLANMNALGAGYNRNAPNRTQVQGLSPINVDWSSLLGMRG